MAKKKVAKKKSTKEKKVGMWAKYYWSMPAINAKVESFIRKNKGIIHGTRAVNVYLPNWLDKHTEDWDVFTNKPKKIAKKLEKQLDKALGGDYFYVKEGKHKGTWKVVSKTNDKEIADFTKPEEKIKYNEIYGMRYVTLDYIKKKINKILRDLKAQ